MKILLLESDFGLANLNSSGDALFSVTNLRTSVIVSNGFKRLLRASKPPTATEREEIFPR